MRKIKILKLTILTAAVLGLGFFWSTGQVQAATSLYVDGKITSSSCTNYTVATRECNGGSATAYKTLQPAINAVSAGSTIYVRAGTYGGFSMQNKHGNPSAWIAIKNYPGEEAIIDEYLSVGCYTPSQSISVQLHVSTYIEIDGLKFTSSHPLLAFPPDEYVNTASCASITVTGEGSGHIRISNNTFTHTGGGVLGFGYAYTPNTWGTSDVEIIGNMMINTGLSKRGHAIYATGSRYTIRGNTIDNPYGLCVQFYSSIAQDDNVIENNTLRNCGHIDYCKNYEKSQCQLSDHDGPPYMSQGGGVYISSGDNNLVQNNLIYNSVSSGIYIRGSATVVNNTVYNNNTNHSSGYYGVSLYGSGGNAHNNIIYANWPMQQLYREIDGSGSDSHNFTTDPSFVSVGTDFRLASNSLAINKGIATNAPTVDIVGTVRPQDAQFDIGAYEYVFGPQTYYIAPTTATPPGDNGNDGLSPEKPWATFTHAMTKLKAGDTLLLKDGTYTESLNVTVSGEEGKPITIKALNDGQAYIVTEYPTSPLIINNKSNLNIEGITLRNSGDYCPFIYNSCGYSVVNGLSISYSDHINIKRVVVNGSSGFNSSVILALSCTNTLLEDVVATGQGRTLINIHGSPSSVTLRRAWARWTGPDTGGGDTPSINQTYDSSNNLFENCIGTSDVTDNPDGWGAWANYVGANDNRFYGNIIVNQNPSSGSFYDAVQDSSKHADRNIFKDNVVINSDYGFSLAGTIDHQSTNNTFIGAGTGTAFKAYKRDNTNDTDGDIKNTSFVNWAFGINVLAGINSVTESYNNFYQTTNRVYGQAESATDTQINPAYKTTIYDNGAYLMIPPDLLGRGEGGADIGAEVIYRYVDGVKTTAPLWPWPMESRICAETGYSVTYENPTNCKQNGTNASYGGGLWKTLDGVYDNLADVNEDGRVNIKDIQICIKAIVSPELISETYLSNCKKVAPPDTMVNIKDIQAIIREIIEG